MTEHGKVQRGGIVFLRPLPLPEGTEVVVQIEPVSAERQSEAPVSGEEFARLPFFGMWAGRPDMDDSTAWVRSERDRWRRRVPRGD
jgi:hypothetical protein